MMISLIGFTVYKKIDYILTELFICENNNISPVGAYSGESKNWQGTLHFVYNVLEFNWMIF